MVYDLAALRADVRNLVPGYDSTLFPDAQLDIALGQGRRRLSRDWPNRIVETIAAQSTSAWLKLTGAGGVSDWVLQFSTLKAMYYPAPVAANNDQMIQNDFDGIRVRELNGSAYIYWTTSFVSGFTLGQNVTLDYTTPWRVQNLEGAAATTITERVQSALQMVCAAKVCMILAAWATAENDAQVPGDLMNHRDKGTDYHEIAQGFMLEYAGELGLDLDSPPPVIRHKAFIQDDQLGLPYLTHNIRGRR